ncbi:MAG: hypothetical protein EBU46_00550 [Nitrosomonadaceae bacterium]|nr:hypothetical protein [Nitrosomonadaceae bacterium]
MLATVMFNLVLKPLGQPLIKFEVWVQRLFNKNIEKTAPPGVTTFFLAACISVLVMVGHLVYLLGVAIVTACTVNPLLVPVFVFLGIGVAMTVLIAKYKYINGTLDANCKVNYYYVVWLLLILVAVGYSSFGGPLGFFAACWTHLIAHPASIIWAMAMEAWGAITGWLSTTVAYCWKLLVVGLNFKVYGCYWWLWAGGLLTGFTLLGNWLMKQAFINNINNFTPTPEANGAVGQEQQRNRAAWRYIIWKGLTLKEGALAWRSLLHDFSDELRRSLATVPSAGVMRPDHPYNGSLHWEQSTALSYYWSLWKADLLDVIFAPLLDELQQQRCPAQFEWHATAVDFDGCTNGQTIVNDVAAALNQAYGLKLNYNENRGLSVVLGVVARRESIAKDFAEGLKSVQREIAIQAQAARDAEKQRQNPRRSLLELVFGSKERANELCAKTTGALAAPFVAGWALIARGWLEFCTFLAWAKIYAKSKKQGVCPYMTFKD